MATAPKEPRKLTFVEIVMNAEADVIKAAYEARVEVDKLLAQREEAYRHIAELESGVERIIGEPGVFAFPPPPLPVAGTDAAAARSRRPAKPAGEAAAPAAPKGSGEPGAGARTAAEEAPAAEKTATQRPESAERPAARNTGSPTRPH